MVLAPDPRLFVPAKGRAGRIKMVAIGPDPARFDRATGAIGGVCIARPDPGAQTEDGVIGDLDRLVLGLEGGHRHDRPEDLLLEDPHLVGAFKDGRLDIEAFRDIAVEMVRLAAGQHFRAFLRAEFQIGRDLIELLF